jgi:hypothetical protein
VIFLDNANEIHHSFAIILPSIILPTLHRIPVKSPTPIPSAVWLTPLNRAFHPWPELRQVARAESTKRSGLP